MEIINNSRGKTKIKDVNGVVSLDEKRSPTTDLNG